MAFSEITSTGLSVSSVSASVAVEMSGSPNMMFLTAGTLSTLAQQGSLAQSFEQANSIFYAVGPAPIVVTPSNGALLKPGLGESVGIPIVGGQPAYVSAIGASGNALSIVLGVQS